MGGGGAGNDPYYRIPFRELFGPADGAGISKFNARRKILPTTPLPPSSSSPPARRIIIININIHYTIL